MADVISQSFGTGEDAFGSSRSLLNLRDAYVAAAQNGVTVLASSGDDGSAVTTKQPVAKGGKLLPDPGVNWPASDPLVTGVGGTYLCTDATNTTARVLDNVSPPANCQGQSQAEIAWIDAGGGFSHVFARPAYQDSLPAGSTTIPPDTRGVPDIGLQASSRTGALVYTSPPPDGNSGLICGGALQHGLVRHRRHVAVVPAVGGPGRDRRPDQRRRARPDQPGAVRGRRQPGAVRELVLRRHDREQPGLPGGPRLPGDDGLGPGHRTRHAQRRQPAARSREGGAADEVAPPRH